MRECGDCTLCCELLEVGEPLNLAAGERCPNQGTVVRHHSDGTMSACEGCTIYHRRPQVCRDYECEWLKGEFSDYMYPRESGVVVSRLQNHFGEYVEARFSSNVLKPLKAFSAICFYCAANNLVLNLKFDEESIWCTPGGVDSSVSVALSKLRLKGGDV